MDSNELLRFQKWVWTCVSPVIANPNILVRVASVTVTKFGDEGYAEEKEIKT